MKRIITVVSLAVFMVAVSHVAFAAEFGTPQEAEAMVKKAVAEIKAVGKDKALAEISNPKGKFIDRDLYVFVYDIKGKCVGHGFNQKMIGKDLAEMKDPDGKFYVKERIEITKTKGQWLAGLQVHEPLIEEDREQDRLHRKRSTVSSSVAACTRNNHHGGRIGGELPGPCD